MKKSISVFLFLLIISSNLFSQVTQEWVRRYNGLGNETGSSIKLDMNGNVIVAGTSENSLVVIKYNNDGDSIWTSMFQGAYLTRVGKSLDIDNEGNIYINGTGLGNNTDIYTIKYDSNGIQQWVSIYSSTGYSDDWSVKIEIGKDGFVYVLGNISPIIYDYRYLTVKYNPLTGDTIWTRIFDIGGGTGPFDMVLDDNSNIYITGSSGGIRTIKYSSEGVLKWISASELGEPHAIDVDKQGNVYVTGELYGSSTEMDIKTIKYDASGVISWVKIFNNYGVNHYDDAFSVAVDDSSNAFVAGISEDIHSNDEYLVIKYSTSGIIRWSSHYIGIGYHNDWLSKIIIDKYGNSYVTGYTCYDGPNVRQYTTVKYSSLGSQVWVQHYRNMVDGDDRARDMISDSIGNIYVTGSSYRNGTGYDIATIKYSQPIGIKPISSEVPKNFSLSQNYPNPFNPKTIINYELPITNYVKLIVFDILGREIAMLVNERQLAGKYKVQWDGSNYPSGVYFYRLVVSGAEPLNIQGYSETKKMVLLK